jgi:hypothetical protein
LSGAGAAHFSAVSELSFCGSAWQAVSAHAGLAVMTPCKPISMAADMIADITLE